MRVAGMDLLDSGLLRILDLLRLPEMSTGIAEKHQFFFFVRKINNRYNMPHSSSAYVMCNNR
jgi:hypothetical protein